MKIQSCYKVVTMDKCEKFYKYYKENPIEFYEDYFGIKLTKFQKIKFKIYNIFIRHLQELVEKQREIIDEILIEPYGSLSYDFLKLHMYILDLKITLIKELFRI